MLRDKLKEKNKLRKERKKSRIKTGKKMK